MAEIAHHPAHSHPAAVRIVERQLSNICAALQASQLIGEEEAQQILAESFIAWAVGTMAGDMNPEGSARELCRNLLSAAAEARRAATTGVPA
jgi:hypothetical protein